MAEHETTLRPELIELNSVAKHRVQQYISAKGGHCEHCGATGFDVGHGMYLGFLFLNEDDDAYMVALTCRNPECPMPRTGIVLPEKEFLNYGADAAGRATTSQDGDDR
ncbi:MAG TPA: hypothetical protein VME67_25410 [Mycobacterium sp.]|nr:hypothetical protein [Mycobacterium sp.]HTX97881.1 hypothetical protein [Mycobacterium sp.]